MQSFRDGFAVFVQHDDRQGERSEFADTERARKVNLCLREVTMSKTVGRIGGGGFKEERFKRTIDDTFRKGTLFLVTRN